LPQEHALNSHLNSLLSRSEFVIVQVDPIERSGRRLNGRCLDGH
jgi:hypothetical protein